MSDRSYPRKPWLHARSGMWCVQISGKRHYLDRDPVLAQRKLKKLLQEQRRRDGGCREWLDAPFSDLADEFLDFVKACQKPATYRTYQMMLQLALGHLGPAINVGGMRRIHLTKLKQVLTGNYSPTTVFKAIHAVQRVFNWAVANDLLDINPLAKFEKPKPRERTRIIASEEFRAMLRGSGAPFRRFLLALRFCGCRPGELRRLVWDEVFIDQEVLILPEHKTLTRQKHPRPRIIPLPKPIVLLLRWLSRNSSGDHNQVFLNSKGKPWTPSGLISQMRRLRLRVGLNALAGEQIVLYSARHSFATERAGKVSDIELAALLGHEGTAMTQKYVHLNLERMRDIQKRADR